MSWPWMLRKRVPIATVTSSVGTGTGCCCVQISGGREDCLWGGGVCSSQVHTFPARPPSAGSPLPDDITAAAERETLLLLLLQPRRRRPR